MSITTTSINVSWGRRQGFIWLERQTRPPLAERRRLLLSLPVWLAPEWPFMSDGRNHGVRIAGASDGPPVLTEPETCA
jgi:hypothetical protein